MPLPWGLDYIQKEWSVIKKIPIAIIVIIMIVYFSINWIFKERLTAKNDLINTKNDKIVSLNEKIASLEKELESKPEIRYRKTITIYEDAKSKWTGKKKKQVIGKTFQNERIELDGYSYRNCEFIDVTFVYKGETPYDLIDIVCIGTPNFDISSSKSLSGLVQLLEATDNLKNVKVNYINK